MFTLLRQTVLCATLFAVVGLCACASPDSRGRVITADEMPTLPERGSSIGFTTAVEGAEIPTRDLVGTRLTEPVGPTPEEREIIGEEEDPYAALMFPPPPQPSHMVWSETGGATVYSSGQGAIYFVGPSRSVSMAGTVGGAIYGSDTEGRRVSAAGPAGGMIAIEGRGQAGATVETDTQGSTKVGVQRRR